MSERVRRPSTVDAPDPEGAGQMIDPGLGFVTITSVDTLCDFEHATVYVSLLNNSSGRSLRAGARAKARLQAQVGRRVTLRRRRPMRFVYDETFDKGAAIERLLMSTEAHATDRAGPRASRAARPGRAHVVTQGG